jgi:8-hydroxy-5-deazaflavin:NADPH oxidoreductase
MNIALVGGTGREGRGLALRWKRAGHAVFIGSRDGAKGRARATELGVEGGGNQECIDAAEVVLMSVPYGAHAETLRTLSFKGRVLIDITVPLQPPKVGQVHLPVGRAAAIEAQAIVGPETPVVAALHHVSSAVLGDPDRAIECDVLVCGDDEAARATAIRLIADLGARAFDAGPLVNAIALESLTPVLLHLNKKYKATTGIRFTGLTPGA